MMKIDPYETLGVSKDATQDQIKKAYRKLARQYHPDVNPGDKEAEERFKQLSEAYDILGDAEKRKEYDNLGQQAFYDQAFGGAGYQRPDFSHGFSFEDLFGDLFGGASRGGGGGFDYQTAFGGFQGRQAGPRKGGDLVYRLTIGFHEAVFGTETRFDLERPVSCSACGGQGLDLSAGQACSECGGTGRVTRTQGQTQVMTVCQSCGGSGRTGETRACPSCGGTGQTTARETIQARIPAGVNTGQKVRLAGKGQPGPGGGPAGDLYLEIEVRPDPVFKRDGQNINIETEISLFDAVLGGRIEVPTLTGKAAIKVPAGTQSGRRFRLKGKGVPATKKKPEGDLYVAVKIRIPEDLSPEAVEMFEKLKALIRRESDGEQDES